MGKKAASCRLAREIDETTEFALPDPEVALLEVNCREVSRINSRGIRSWMHFFGGLRRAGVKLRFVDCSPAVVDLMNTFHGFIRTDEVVSILLPYHCTQCRQDHHAILRFDAFVHDVSTLGHSRCPACGGAAALDDNPTSYLRCVIRRQEERQDLSCGLMVLGFR